MTTMSQAACVRRHGVSPKTATMWKQSGLIVVTEEGVDVEASDERLRKYRNRHDGRAQRGAPKAITQSVTQGASNVQGNAGAVGKVTAGRVQLTLGEIERRLQALDWTQTFDWDPEAQAARARQAAECVGFLAVTSDFLDDGHWGEFQLRDPRWIRDGRMLDGAVLAGYGYEASVLEVLRVCRKEVALDSEADPDDLYAVDLKLLPLLAYPHHEADRPCST